jgi:hypothetical protein
MASAASDGNGVAVPVMEAHPRPCAEVMPGTGTASGGDSTLDAVDVPYKPTKPSTLFSSYNHFSLPFARSSIAFTLRPIR